MDAAVVNVIKCMCTISCIAIIILYMHTLRMIRNYSTLLVGVSSLARISAIYCQNTVVAVKQQYYNAFTTINGVTTHVTVHTPESWCK